MVRFQIHSRSSRPRGESVDEAGCDAPVDTPPDDPLISVVVVFWAGSPSPQRCLRTIRSAGDRIDDAAEIIVVDNGTGSDLAAELSGLWDHWIEVSENLGPSHARNIGARHGSGSLVAFVDDDACVDGEYFRKALSYFDDQQVVGIRGRIRPLDHPLFCTLATHYDRGADAIEDALITEGACVVRRRDFLEAGGFPVDVNGHEGIELTHRLRQVRPDGITLYVPDVVLRHDYVESFGEFVSKTTRHARNEVDVETRDPSAAEFLTDYFEKDFPRPRLSVTEYVVHHGLCALRFLLQCAARWYARCRPGGDS